MRANRTLLCLTALAMLAVLTACGGGRPPVVAAPPPPPPADTADSSESTMPDLQPVDTGPDIQRMGNERIDEGLIDMGPGGESGPLDDIHFGYDQFTLTGEAQAVLERHALWLQTHRGIRVTIEGHCDERGTIEYNLALGDQRAQTAREYLVGLGVAPERLTTVSYGKERPVDPGHHEQAWARNRRAHFVVSR